MAFDASDGVLPAVQLRLAQLYARHAGATGQNLSLGSLRSGCTGTLPEHGPVPEHIIASKLPDIVLQQFFHMDLSQHPYNLCSPPHSDVSNVGDSMILPLAYNEGGDVWVEASGGVDFMEVSGRSNLVSGTAHSLQGQALQFPAQSLVHATMPWSVFDRVVLIAYTAMGWERFSSETPRPQE